MRFPLLMRSALATCVHFEAQKVKNNNPLKNRSVCDCCCSSFEKVEDDLDFTVVDPGEGPGGPPPPLFLDQTEKVLFEDRPPPLI